MDCVDNGANTQPSPAAGGNANLKGTQEFISKRCVLAGQFSQHEVDCFICSEKVGLMSAENLDSFECYVVTKTLQYVENGRL